VDVLLSQSQVVRCFEDDDIVHVAGKVDPLDDIDVINLELALADLAQIEKRMDRLKKGKRIALHCFLRKTVPLGRCHTTECLKLAWHLEEGT